MNAPGEAKPSRGPKGAAARDSHEGDVRSLDRHEQSKEAEEMSAPSGRPGEQPARKPKR